MMFWSRFWPRPWSLDVWWILMEVGIMILIPWAMVLGMPWAFISHEHSSGKGGVMSYLVSVIQMSWGVNKWLWKQTRKTKWTKASCSVSMHNTSPQHAKEIRLEPCNSEYARLPRSIHLQPSHSFAYLLGSCREHRTFADLSMIFHDFPSVVPWFSHRGCWHWLASSLPEIQEVTSH